MELFSGCLYLQILMNCLIFLLNPYYLYIIYIYKYWNGIAMCANGLLHNGLIVVVHDDGVHIVLVTAGPLFQQTLYLFRSICPTPLGPARGGITVLS